MSEPGSTYEEQLFAHYRAEEKAAIARARRDVNSFIEYVVIDPRARPIDQSGCHIMMHDHLDNQEKALVCFPRDHGKTTQVTVGRTLFYLGRNPDLRLKVVCAADKLAMKRVRAVRGYIEHSKQLHQVFPDLVRSEKMVSGWTDHSLVVKRESLDLEPSLEGAGILSTATGGRADILIADDVCDFANSVASPAKREGVKSSFDDVWVNLLPANGRVWYIYTPWHKADLSADLERRARQRDATWSLLKLQVLDRGSEFVPVWPEVWSSDALKIRRNDIGTLAFARGFLLEALDDDSCPLLPFVPLMKVATEPGWLYQEPAVHWPRVMAVDPAIRRGKKSSETCIMTVVLEPNGRKWVDPSASFCGRLSSPETAKMIGRIWNRTKADLVLVENNTYQQALLEWIDEALPGALHLPLQAWTTGAQKMDEMVGVPGMAVEMERGGWALPFGPNEHDEDCPCILCKLCDQVEQWPVGEKNDALMAWWICSQAAKKVGAVVISENLDIRPDDWTEQDEFGGLYEIEDDMAAI